jgi:hypothetical protein
MNVLELTADQLKQLDTADFEGMPQEIHYFLIDKNGNWEIDDDRPRTLRACWEVLCRLPQDVADQIMFPDGIVLFAATKFCWGLARPMSFPALPSIARSSILLRTGQESSSGGYTWLPNWRIKTIVSSSPLLRTN